MIQRSRYDSETIELLTVERIRRALHLLLEASEYARRVACDPWEFAVDIGQFRRLDLTDNDLRFLMRMKCLDHAEEVTSSTDSRRVFRSAGTAMFTKRTCFVMTSLGMSVENQVAAASRDVSHHSQESVVLLSSSQRKDLPCWDSYCRVLSFEGRTVKQFKFPAINQEQVLSVFQEEHWPQRILDPLAPLPGLDVKRRLSDTIKCLNRGHIYPLLRFRGDGTGEGIFWEAAS